MNKNRIQIGCIDGKVLDVHLSPDEVMFILGQAQVRLSKEAIDKLTNDLTRHFKDGQVQLPATIQDEASNGGQKSTWNERAKHYLDGHSKYRGKYKKEKLSLVERWVYYALHYGFNPGVYNQDAVEDFMKPYSDSTLNSYHRHLKEWFSICRRFGW